MFIVHEKSVSVIYVYFTVPAEKKDLEHTIWQPFGDCQFFFGGGDLPKNTWNKHCLMARALDCHRKKYDLHGLSVSRPAYTT